jgi:hypothetical protein
MDTNFPGTGRIFYAEPISSIRKCPEPVVRPNYFYLHKQAENINGYDICMANIEAMKYCLNKGAFLCQISFADDTIKDTICFTSFVEGRRMEGLICLLDDIEGIQSCIEYFNIREMVYMYSDEKEYLLSIDGMKDAIKKAIETYNSKLKQLKIN